jgi:hypothetical protein
MGIGLMRVEIELASLSVLAAEVLAVLADGLVFKRLFNSTVGATPPLRPEVVSPARQENKDALPQRKNASLRSISRIFFHSLAFATSVESRPAPPAS